MISLEKQIDYFEFCSAKRSTADILGVLRLSVLGLKYNRRTKKVRRRYARITGIPVTRQDTWEIILDVAGCLADKEKKLDYR